MDNFYVLEMKNFSYFETSEIFPNSRIMPFIDNWIVGLINFSYSYDGKKYDLILLMKMKMYLFLVESIMKVIIVNLRITFQPTFKIGFIGVKQVPETYLIKPEIY